MVDPGPALVLASGSVEVVRVTDGDEEWAASDPGDDETVASAERKLLSRVQFRRVLASIATEEDGQAGEWTAPVEPAPSEVWQNRQSLARLRRCVPESFLERVGTHGWLASPPGNPCPSIFKYKRDALAWIEATREVLLTRLDEAGYNEIPGSLPRDELRRMNGGAGA